MHPIEFSGTGAILKENESVETIYFIKDGKIQVSKDDVKIKELENGDFIGMMSEVYNSENSQYTFTYDNDIELYMIRKADLLTFLDKNPGLIVKIRYNF